MPATAWTFTSIYSFPGGANGAYPVGGLTGTGSGPLYGTTANGGQQGKGTVFSLNNGAEAVIYSFCSQKNCADGAFPQASLIEDGAGNLYGTTTEGGGQYGTVFELSSAGTESVLLSMNAPAEGCYPLGPVLRDASGDLFGTTQECAQNAYGAAFELTNEGQIRSHSFQGQPLDGSNPAAGLIEDSAGDIFGTTSAGGPWLCGVVFEFTATGTEKILHYFQGGANDGCAPSGELLMDANGNLYGTTLRGGQLDVGTAFTIRRSGAERLLHSFGGGADGASPMAGLVADSNGNLLGTTALGGNGAGCGVNGCGTVFEISNRGGEAVLHGFSGSDGYKPQAPLFEDSSGNFYGTTVGGGKSGLGTVFELSPQ